MLANKGIKKFGERAIAAMFKEYKQLNDGVIEGKPVVKSMDAALLTPQDKKRALETVNLIKKKRSGDLKGRTCADGSK